MRKETANKNRYNRRRLILMADDHFCQNCGADETEKVLDVVFYGEDEDNASFEDFILLCRKCNKNKVFALYSDKEKDQLKKARTNRLKNRYGIEYSDVKEEFEREGKIRGRRRFFEAESDGS